MASRMLQSACAAALALVTLASIANAQQPQPTRVAVSGTVGLFVPVESTMRNVYGSALLPVAGQVELRVAPRVWVFGGIRWVSTTGEALAVDSNTETYPSSLGLTAFRFGSLIALPVARRWDLAAGVGVSVTSYDETWPGTELAATGRATGFMVQAEVRRTLTTRWSAVGRFEYSTITASPADVPSVNVGGLDLQVGARFAF